MCSLSAEVVITLLPLRSAMVCVQGQFRSGEEKLQSLRVGK